MTDTDTLILWYEQRRVGEQWHNPAGAIGFRYDPEWLDHGFAVSRSEMDIRTISWCIHASAAHRVTQTETAFLTKGAIVQPALPTCP
jgi:serine/threonine-protein kinase HipA